MSRRPIKRTLRVPDQPHSERQSRAFRIAHCGTEAGVRNGHDDVGVHRRLACQQTAQVHAHFVDAQAKHVAVGPRKVDMLEHTMRGRRRWKRLVGMEAITIDDQDLARLNLPLGTCPRSGPGRRFPSRQRTRPPVGQAPAAGIRAGHERR